MSRDQESDLPPELQSAMGREKSGADSDLEAVWRLLERAALPDEAVPEAEATWRDVRRHIEADDSAKAEPNRRARDRQPRRSAASSRRVTHWPWGAAVVVVLGIAVAVWMATQPVVITAPPGETVTRTLPDESTVELSPGTRLSYPWTFSSLSILENDQRTIRLQGEAYFDVESGSRPFIVRTPTARVEVVGTAFSVRSWATDANETLVALAEGRLRVTGPTDSDTTEGVTLRPGQAVRVGPAGPRTAPRDTSIERLMAWRRGGFAVTEESLPDILQALERRYGTTLRIDASVSEATRSSPLTLYYPTAVELEVILDDVCMARDLTYRATANGYVLTRQDGS